MPTTGRCDTIPSRNACIHRLFAIINIISCLRALDFPELMAGIRRLRPLLKVCMLKSDRDDAGTSNTHHY
jgi:hypothetical protein